MSHARHARPRTSRFAGVSANAAERRGQLTRRGVALGVAGTTVLGLPVLAAAPAFALSSAPASVWEAVARCESSGDWAIDTGNGYYGGLQFSEPTWLGYGGGGYARYANQASPAQQMTIADRVLAGQGWGAWPVCSRISGAVNYSPPPPPPPAPAAPRRVTHPVARHPAATVHRAPAPVGVQRHAPQVAQRQPAGPAARPAARRTAPAAAQYTVRPGDTLSGISARFGTRGGWVALYAANRAEVGANPNLLRVGEHLHV